MPEGKGLTQDRVRELALSMPEAVESSHQGTADFRVRGKIFATLPPGSNDAVVKIEPANLDLFVQSDPATFRDAWAGRWMRIDLARIDPDLFDRLLIDAWCLVASRKLVKAFQEGEARSAPAMTLRDLLDEARRDHREGKTYPLDPDTL